MPAKKSGTSKKSKSSTGPVRGILYYMYMDSCIFCNVFNETWESLAHDMPTRIEMEKINIRDVKRKSPNKTEKLALENMGDTVPSIVFVDLRETKPSAIRYPNDREREKILTWVEVHSADRDSKLMKIQEIQDVVPEVPSEVLKKKISDGKKSKKSVSKKKDSKSDSKKKDSKSDSKKKDSKKAESKKASESKKKSKK